MAERVARRGPVLTALVGLLTAAALALPVARASAEPEGARIISFSATPSTTQAGGHPNVVVEFRVGTRTDPLIPHSCNCNQIKDARVELPPGFIGDPHSTPQCTVAQFTLNICPVDSQVGVANPAILINDSSTPSFAGDRPLYNLVPPPGQAGLLAFTPPIFQFPIYTVLSARTDDPLDYGLTAEVKGITSFFGLGAFRQEIWGVPASPANDPKRFGEGTALPEKSGGETSNSPERPFLSNPTDCSGGLTSTFTSTAYDHGVHVATAPWPTPTGCDQLGFKPSLSAQPSTVDADSASGVDVVLDVPQNASPTTPSDSEIRAATVKLPAGFSINPNAADGKTSCSDSEARLGTEAEAACPEFAKVGTLSLLSAALPAAIPGGIYLGEPKPGDRYRLILTADGYGTHVKLPGSVRPDPATGQLTVDFTDLPQSPLTEFDLHFFGSERGLLATPERCGTYPVESRFVPWATGLPDQTSTQFFKIEAGPGGSPCPGPARPFTPAFRAAGANSGAGAHGAFSAYVSRPDGDQTLSTIAIKTPPGFSATLRGVPACPGSALREAEAASYTGAAERVAPRCPAASQVGVSNVAAGAGSKPLYVPGKVYLAGPYAGAPLSLAVITPAVSGPYDLGNVVNRVAVRINPITAAVEATSDPLPQILDGIPLRLRSVLINLDRSEFALNPTHCSPLRVLSSLTGNQGAVATPSSFFQVANCDTLTFAPKLRLRLSGATKRGGNPALTATLTQPTAGAANLASTVVTLPHSEFLDQGHIGTICTRVQFAADACPAASVYGRARAVTPILDGALEGPVYLRSSSHRLPDLVAALHGPASQPIEIDLAARIDSVNGGIRASFESIPDAPVSKFVLAMRGGKRGLLDNSVDLCQAANRATVKLRGQNGVGDEQRPVLAAPCRKRSSGGSE